MYECLVGYPPFYAEDPMATCRKIVKWKQTLQFPPEAKLSKEAEDLIRNLICEAPKRLTFEGIKAHPFFRGVDWDNLRKLTAPIVPNVKDDVDTQNFDKFHDDTTPPAAGDAASEVGAGAAGHKSQHAPDSDAFVGYTFKRETPGRPNVSQIFAGGDG